MNDPLPAARDRLAEEQHQIIGLRLRKRRIEGLLLLLDDGDRLGGDTLGNQGGSHQLRNLVGPAITQIVVAVTDVDVEMAGDLSRNSRHILVAPVARAGHADDPAPARLEPVDQVDHCPHRRLVVPVVEDHPEAVFVEHIHPPRALEETVLEGAQSGADLIQCLAERVRHAGGEHGVFDIVQCLAFQRRPDQMGPDQRHLSAIVVDHDLVAVQPLLKDDRGLAEPDMFAHQFMLRVARHIHDLLGGREGRHFQRLLVIGVQHHRAPRDFRDNAFHPGKAVQSVDAAEAQMIRSDVQNRAYIAEVIAKAGTDDAAARRLQDGDVDRRIAQHHIGRQRPRHVALDGHIAVDHHGVGRGLPHHVTRHFQDVRQHARAGGLAVRSGQGGDGNARLGARREQHVHDRPAHVARRALRRRDMHAQARPRIDLADAAAGLAVALGDIGGQEIHGADIEPDRLDRPLGHQFVVGMDRVGDIHRRAARRNVRGLAQIHLLTVGGDRLCGVALLLQQCLGLSIEFEPGQHVFMPDTAAGILIDDIHQLGNGVVPVALHMTRHPARGGDELAVDHQKSVVVAAQHGLHHHGRSFGIGGVEGGGDAVLASDVDGDAPAMIAVERLDDHGIADAFGRPERLVDAVNQPLLRHGQTEIGKEAVGEVLVRRDLDGDMRGLRRQRRLDPLLVLALADLDQAGVVESVDRNVAGLGRTYQFHGRGPQRTPFGIGQEIIDVFVEFSRPLLRAGDGREHVTGNLAGLDTDVLIAVAVEHLDDV